MRERQCSAGDGPHQVTAACLFLGQDLCMAFGGGTRPHIGATALASPRPSLEGKGKSSASASVLCVPGHKEDLLARALALEAAARLGCRVSVSVGLHIDNAGKEDIALLQENCMLAFERLLEAIEGSGGEAAEIS